MMNNKGRQTMNIYLVVFFSIVFQLQNAIGQIEVEEEPKRLYYDRTRRVEKLKDMKDMRDVLHKDKLLMGKNRISGSISYNTGRILIDNGREKHYEIRSAIGYFIRIRFFEQFSLNATFYQDFNPKAAARWTSNYTYSIARYNWKPNRFNFGYENYINNRYSDNIDDFTRKFLEGYYFVSYSNVLSQKFTEKIKFDNTTNFKYTLFTRYYIQYRDENEVEHGGLFNGKPTVGAGFRYTIFKNIYIESAAYFYFSKAQQQPWDPDYTYGFGYFDWRSFRCSLTYGNWAVNRFPWNKQTVFPNYGFLDGNFRFIINWIW